MEASQIPTASPNANSRAIVVRDRLTLDSPVINTDFLYNPFKGGQSVLGVSQGTSKRMTYPVPVNMQVAMGLPTQQRYIRKAV